ncbi:hypothetical protein ASPNIDRAFT_122227, partial [Aspergillus niger ATCC 1015]
MDSASTTRSCRRCSLKKIRCDKSQPCASCIKSASECVLEKEVQVLTHKLDAVNHRSKHHSPPTENRRAVEGEHGKLLVDRGSIHYINHEYSSMAVSLSDFYPSSALDRILWNLFEENVAPLAMIFHKPWLASILNSAGATAIADYKAFEAVRFAVYFAATTSMSPEQCTETFSQCQPSLQRYYHFATQQASARANFLQSQSLTVLQATTLFLTCLRGADDAAFVRAMTAAVHRIAQGLGLHRDGTYLGLSPFETEVRRRLWWAIYSLDCQSSEFRAIGTQIREGTYDTKLPLNIHDSDISPESSMSAAEQVSLMARSDVEDLKWGKLFVIAIEILEFAYLLETDPRTKKWSRLFQGYPQWHAAIFVLKQI